MKIKTLETSLDGKTRLKTRQIQPLELPEQVKRNTGNTYDAKNRRITSRWLWDIFTNNEYKAYERKAINNDRLRKDFLLRFKSHYNIQQKFRKYKITIGMYRRAFNQQKLFQSQPPPYLVSFSYDLAGYIVVGGNYPNSYMSFQDCYQQCVNLEIADPRFVPPEYIIEIRNRQLAGDTAFSKWIVPDAKTIEQIARRTGKKELYNSVKFYRGFTREETPADWEEE